MYNIFKYVFSLRIFFQQRLVFFQVVDINFYVLMLVLNQYFLQVSVFTQWIGFMCLLSLFLSLLTKLLRVYSWAVTPPSMAAKLAHAGLIVILNVIDCQTISVILKSVKTAFNIVISSSWKWMDVVTWTINFFFPPVHSLLIGFNDRIEIYTKMHIESEFKATFHLAVRYDIFIKIIKIIHFIQSATWPAFQKVLHSRRFTVFGYMK